MDEMARLAADRPRKSRPAPTRPVTHERLGRALAGGAVLICLTLGWLLHPIWLIGAALTSGNLILSAITDRCAVRSLLIRLGLPGERDVGRAEACENLECSRPAAARGRTLAGRLAERARPKTPADLN